MRQGYGFKLDHVRRAQAQTLLHKHQDWGLIKADFVRRTGLLRQETRLAPDRHVLLINLRGDATIGEDFVDGQRVAFTPRRAGSIIFLPADSQWRGWDEGDAVGSYLLVSLDKVFAERTIGGSAVKELKPIIGFRDRVLQTCLQQIAAEVISPDWVSPIMVESQAVLALIQLVRLNARTLELAKGGLSSFDLKRALAVLETPLTEPPQLSDLAHTAGVSRRHFVRAFKTSTGKTPHAYARVHRLEQAADLLRTTKLSATDVAMQTGFGSSSYFARAFRQEFGFSPLEYRKNWQS